MTYSKLTKEGLKEGLGLMDQIKPKNTKFYARTGEAGWNQFHNAMKRVYATDLLAEVKNKLTEHEYDAILDMITSNDDRDLVLAEAILETKKPT